MTRQSATENLVTRHVAVGTGPQRIPMSLACTCLPVRYSVTILTPDTTGSVHEYGRDSAETAALNTHFTSRDLPPVIPEFQHRPCGNCTRKHDEITTNFAWSDIMLTSAQHFLSETKHWQLLAARSGHVTAKFLIQSEVAREVVGSRRVE